MDSKFILRSPKDSLRSTTENGQYQMFKKPEFSMRNVKPQRKNQDSTGGMVNFSPRDLFAYIANIMAQVLCKPIRRFGAISPDSRRTLLYNCRKYSTNRPIFLQNKANFRKSQMDVTLNIARDYKKKSKWTLGENKPNQSQFCIKIS